MDSIVNQPKTKRGQKTLNKILKAAEGLFYQKGYHGTSIIDITNESEIALGTFYIYFKDKYSLYKYLLLIYSHEIRKAVAEKIKENDSRYDKERIGLYAFLNYMRVNKHVYNILWESLYIDKNIFVDYYESFSIRYVEGLRKSRDAGEVSEVDLTVLSYVLMGISNFIGLKYVMFEDDESVDFEAVVDSVMDILENGMFKK